MDPMSAPDSLGEPIELFFSYAHKDKGLRDELAKHLSVLVREGVITGWYDGQIVPGVEFDREIAERLDRARIILLLIRADFIVSDYCYIKEMKRALERHAKGEARVIPVILRACRWQRTPLGKLEALPGDGKPVASWSNQDEAFNDV